MSNKRAGRVKIVKNNLYILKLAFGIAPWYVVQLLFDRMIGGIFVFFEHTFTLMYIADCIEFHRPFSYVAIVLTCFFIAICLNLLRSSICGEAYFPKAKEKLNRALRLAVYEKATTMDLKCYDTPGFYNDFVWCMKEMTDRVDKVLLSIGNLLRYLVLMVTIIIFMGTLDPIGFLFVAAVFIPTLLLGGQITKLKYEVENGLKPEQRKSDYINRVFYLKDYIKEIRLSTVKDKLYKDFENAYKNCVNIIKTKTKKIVVLDFLNSYIFNFAVICGGYVFYLLYRAFVLGNIGYAKTYGLYRAVNNLSGALSNFTGIVFEMQENSLYIDRIFKFMEYENTIKDSEETEIMPREPKGLELSNVSFSYDGDANYVLKNINMRIKPGEKIAIVGYNGAGKTSLVKLMMRLYDPDKGQIDYNGIDIRNYRLGAYRDRISAVFQDYQLFALTMAENVVMDDAVTDRERLIGAINASGLEAKLTSLKNGTDTLITQEFDKAGTGFSGGEAQKLAISRAFYKDSDVLILDEPSSALDPISEYDLNKAMMERADGKTVIFISHRLSTTKLADRIYMLENGEIIEQGCHDELMAFSGKYAEMFNMQAEKYRANIYNVNKKIDLYVK